MPASNSRDTRSTEGEIRAVVARLSRPDGDGGATIERAAILAEGTPSAAIEAWIIDNGGLPDTATITRPATGNYRLGRDAPSFEGRAPRRYLLPAGALHAGS